MSRTAQLLQAARHAAGLSQRALAERCGFRQPNIARIESGAHDTSAAHCDRLVAAAGFRLALLPAHINDVITASEDVRRALSESREPAAFRRVIQLADDLAAVHGAERVAAAVAGPASTGDRGYDALLAGVVETRLDEESLAHPKWLGAVPVLDEAWFVSPWTNGDRSVVAATPPALRRRGVYLDAAELASI